MFVTLRCGSDEGDEIRCIESTTRPPHEGPANPHLACSSCRSKKLKCSGEVTGCQRCLSSSIKCVYLTEKPNEKKRKHNPLADKRTGPQAYQTPRQSKLQSATRNDRSDKFNSPSRAGSSASGTVILGTLEDQDQPSQIENYPNIQIQPASVHQDQGMNEDLVLTALSPTQRPTSKDAPPVEIDQDDFNRDFFAQHFAPLESNDDMFSRALQHAINPLPGEDSSSSADILQSIASDQPFPEQAFIFSPPATPAFPTPPRRTSQAVISTSTSSSGSGRTNRPRRCSSISSAGGPSGCQCTRSALRILETLSIHSKPEDLYSVEQALYSLKRNIGQCQSLVQCTASEREAGFEFLVIILCEKMTAIFEEVSAGWERQLQVAARTLQQTNGGNGGTTGETPAILDEFGDLQYRMVPMGGYQIDTIEERHTVFGTLILLQLKRLSDIVARLRRNAMTANLESHLAVLTPTHQKVKNLKAALDRIILSHH